MELADVLNSSVIGKMYGRVRSKILCEEMGVTLSETRNLERWASEATLNQRKGEILPEKFLRLEKAGDLHLRGKHVAFKIFYVARKIEVLNSETGSLSLKK
jgi:hypothetical protein